jgi:hypothetical protein
MYLEVDGTPRAEQNVNAQAIVDISVEIGGQQIDKQTGQFMNVWYHLTQPNPTGHVGEVDNNTTTGTAFQNMSAMAGSLGDADGATKTFVPLNFWFNKNPGLALPLIALQYHEVKVILNHDFNAGYSAHTGNKLWCDYIYLDTDERRRFAQVSHEYLIEQVQENTLTAASSSDLTLNHPVKELIWCVGATDGTLAATGSSAATYQLKLNGHDRVAARDWRYFSRVQVHEHHTGCGGLTAAANSEGAYSDGIGVYSFALEPEEHQPSGTCNFSRIDTAQLVASSGLNVNRVYAINYNVLRIMSGMGGLAYSN